MTAPPLIVASLQTRRMLERVRRIARTHEPVLLVGETGVGKELLARWIHDNSPRSHRPFLPLNCMALPETLIESELFGYRRGAFTDAFKDRRGLFESAHGGTVFLDEIGDLPLSIQVKLLRVLDTHEILPLGTHEPRHVDFRFIAATNQDLEERRRRELFRNDLYYRIGVFVIRVAPLRERLEELPALAGYFVRRVNPDTVLTPEVLERLMSYDWPGNIRELRNVVQHAARLTTSGVITLAHLPDWFLESITAQGSQHHLNLKDYRRLFETAVLDAFISDCGGNLKQALKELGVARSSYYRKRRQLRATVLTNS